MLSKEVTGVRFNKAAYRRDLSRKLDSRSDQSIEFKHANISAICISLGYPYVEGYKPRGNYQRLLYEVVAERLSSHQALLEAVQADVLAPPRPVNVDDILAALEPPPEPGRVRSATREDPVRVFNSLRLPINYLEREATNRALGREGERFVVHFEQARLLLARQERLAAQIEHVAESRGDGDGFDVLSFEESGRERLIEVKTTRYGKQTPFYVTRNELRVSQEQADKYHVYRVFGFRREPKMFLLPGAISDTCQLDPAVFTARV